MTHDYRDAMVLANDVLVLNEGKTAQYGDIQQVYQEPNSLVVAQLFGSCNELRGILEEGYFVTPFGKFPSEKCLIHGDVLLIRPESLQLDAAQKDLAGKVIAMEPLGVKYRYTIQAKDELIQLDDYLKEIQIGDQVGFKMIEN